MYNFFSTQATFSFRRTTKSKSTSHGRKYFSDIFMNILPVSLSFPTSFIPSPSHTIVLLKRANDFF